MTKQDRSLYHSENIYDKAQFLSIYALLFGYDFVGYLYKYFRFKPDFKVSGGVQGQI